METSAGDVVVSDQGEDLGLVAVPVIIGTMKDFVHIVDEGGTPKIGLIGADGTTADHVVICGSQQGHGTCGPVGGHSPGQVG
jgi:hypothetical protein